MHAIYNQEIAAIDPSRSKAALSPERRLVLLSFLMLFLELALIRWLGANVLYMSYFSNFVLLGSFLGIGVGFLRSRSPMDLSRWAPVSLAFLIAVVRVFPVEVDRSSSDLIFFGVSTTGLPMWVILPVLFAAVAATMATVAEGVARCFVMFRPLKAYRLDILGSLAGILGFTLLSFLRSPPIGWGVVVVVLMFVLTPVGPRLVQVTALVGIAAMLLTESLIPQDSWSPYYKVTVQPSVQEDTWHIFVNGIPHQVITRAVAQQGSFYTIPYERAGDRSLNDILVVGAGNGTDVAIALDREPERVDAVEIDPRLYEIGRDLHPDLPYSDPRVRVHIEDGRAFLERTRQTYDLILFALPDSLTLVSGQSSLRLESYLFTQEAMEEVKEHLRPDGVFAMYNFYRERWLVDRLGGTLEATFGRRPCLDHEPGSAHLAVFSISSDPIDCPDLWSPVSEPVPDPAVDDHPFVYLETRAIPVFYLWVIALILLGSVGTIRVVAGPLRKLRPYLDLFFMGAAFLLLETKSIVQFSLLFGSTWLVNAIAFGGILLTVFLAVYWAERRPLKDPRLAYLVLVASLALAWLIPTQDLLRLPLGLRLFAAPALAFVPAFLANLVFAERFRSVAASGVAFAANLLGAMMGGLAEYSALIVGYNDLLIGAGALYGLAYLFGREHLTLGRTISP